MYSLSQIPDLIQAMPLTDEQKLSMQIDFHNELVAKHPFMLMGTKQLDKVDLMDRFKNK